jgi:hypothetical protein
MYCFDGRYESEILDIYLSDIIGSMLPTFQDLLNIESLYRDMYPAFDLLQFSCGTKDSCDDLIFASSSAKSGDEIIVRSLYVVSIPFIFYMVTCFKCFI